MHSFLDSFDAKLAESTDETPMAAGNDSVPTVLVCSSELFKIILVPRRKVSGNTRALPLCSYHDDDPRKS